MDTQFIQSNSNYPFVKLINKPIVIYQFVDPLCYQCWKGEFIIKKLFARFGPHFTVRPILCPPVRKDKYEKGTYRYYNQWERYILSLSIKSACLQGNKIGKNYLRNVQDQIFLYRSTESIETIITTAAEQTNIDLIEFYNDLYSSSTLQAYQCDLRLIREMNITSYPTFVFLNEFVDKDSIKVSDVHPFTTYSYILEQLLQVNEQPSEQINIMPLEQYLLMFPRASTREISFVYDINELEAELLLKRLQLRRIISRTTVRGLNVWDYEHM